jgi:tRNA(fMet)-specific endonuclease VapC
VIHLDTSFVVDLLREASKARQWPASRLLASVEDEDLVFSVHAVCELFAGAQLSDRPAEERRKLDALCSSVHVAYPDERFAPVYAALFADLERRRCRIGQMDLLIATAAVVAEARLITRNVKDFVRVRGLNVLSY